MDRIEYFYRETNKHIRNVQLLMNEAARQIIQRGILHDQSKFSDEEKKLFIDLTPALGIVQYGSNEYKELLEQLKPAVEHHNKFNRHHPENYTSGISDMNLLDLLEMICDWIAAAKRSPNGNVINSILMNQKRFGYSDEVKDILLRTVRCFLEQGELLEPAEKFED